MQNDKNEDYVGSFWEMIQLWRMKRRMVKKTLQAIRHGKITTQLYLRLAQQFSDKEAAELMLKAGQVEASVMAEERSLKILEGISLTNANLYKPVKE